MQRRKFIKNTALGLFVPTVFNILVPSIAKADRRGLLISKKTTGGGGSPTFPPDATAYWKMDEANGTRVDFYTGNDLSESAAINAVTGIVNSGADFDGNSRYLQAADSADISMGAGVDFSIAFAFKTDVAPSFQFLLSKNDAGGGGEEYAFRLLSGEGSALRFSLWNAAGAQQSFDTTGTFSSGNIYHLVVTYDQSNIRLYKNGAIDSTHANTEDCRNTASILTFGYDVENGGSFTGMLDEAGIWKRALTAQECSDLYNGGAGNQPS
jgi:hypothetical protein